MSYLPRMSKTYKEPREPLPDEQEQLGSSSILLKPASSLLNEKTQNPQSVLKHYKYLPHAPPVLPGPSVLEEALENELYREASRMKRSASKLPPQMKSTVVIKDEPMVEMSEIVLTEYESKSEVLEKVKRTQSKKTVKGSKTSMGRKKSSKSVRSVNTSAMINMCLVGTDIAKPFTAMSRDGKTREDPDFLSKDELNSLKREKSLMPISCDETEITPAKSQKSSGKTVATGQVVEDEEEDEEEEELEPMKFISRSVQCTIFGSLKKLFVIPLVINSLLRTLAFLLHELSKEEAVSNSSAEKKSLLTQIQLPLGDLCNQKTDKEYSFDTTYSDFKRLEKVVGELRKYMKDVYGDKGEYIDKMEDLRKVFIELKKKDLELTLLKDKVQDREERQETEVVIKESDLKNPEITLQNKRLEGEQLLAEVEFSHRELNNFQRTLAELEWDIRNIHEQTTSLKKSITSKSKTEVIGKKCSVQKFSSEVSAKGNKIKENESSSIKKKP